jgi:hypothetical protein
MTSTLTDPSVPGLEPGDWPIAEQRLRRLREHPQEALKPDAALDQALFSGGGALLQAGRFEVALPGLRLLVRRRPELAAPWNNLGLAYKGLAGAAPERSAEMLALARDAFEQAITRDARFALAHANLSNVLYGLGCVAEARAACERALALEPGNAATRWNLGLCRLLLGEWPGGWLDYEARWEQRHLAIFAPRPFFDRPRWRGDANPAGRTIFVHAEQGLGDTLQFSRYALLLAERGARVVLEVPAPLRILLARSFGERLSVIARGEAIPPFDWHVPLLSLPLAFGTTPNDVPAPLPYLFADAALRERWQVRLGTPSAPRLGLVWTSGISNPARDIALAQLSRLGASPWEILALQTELRPQDAAALARMPGLRWLGADIADFEDTAAIASLCDLVVSVDTSVAHLAAALGAPTCILLPFAPDWRWLLDRDDTPWYPGVHLLRQRAPGDWAPVIAQLLERLHAHPRARASAVQAAHQRDQARR